MNINYHMSHIKTKPVLTFFSDQVELNASTATEAFLKVEISTESRGIVMILNFRTARSGQTVQTQIRLLLEEQSDQGLHCLLFHLYL